MEYIVMILLLPPLIFILLATYWGMYRLIMHFFGYKSLLED